MGLQVGAAKKCINPTSDMYPIPNKISDFGLEPMSQEMPYDDMNCRAIAVDTGKEKLLFLTFELAGAPDYPDYRKKLADACAMKEDAVYIMGTHNHSAPRYRKTEDNTQELNAFIEKYEKLVCQAGIETAVEAFQSLRPARYGYGESISNINVNRNQYTFGGYWVEGQNRNGYSDKTLSIIKFVDMEGKLIAAFLNHPTHATNIYMLKDIDHKAKTSGNFTGIACCFVEKHYGNGAVAMWTSGAAGNQNPFLSHGLQYEYPDGWTSQIQYPDGTGYMQMEYIGRMHGADCCRGIDAITELSDWMPTAHEVERITLPANRCVEEWPPKDFSTIRNGGQGERDEKQVPYGQLPSPAQPPQMVPGEPRQLDLNLLKMGNIAILFANAEIFAEIGRDMKNASPYKNTIIVTHHYGKKCNYLFDKTSKEVLLPMAYGGVIPGEADARIVKGETELFNKILQKEM